MLDKQMLEAMPPGTIFATGTAMDVEGDLFMANTGKELKWIAIRGHGPHDWTIYCHYATHPTQYIATSGDKVGMESNIRKLVPCDDEAYKYYRK
ncbi:MAG: hypothetical protein JRJ62_15695 [Deltaproteobacteria bacterium]|nr:hypothetical protein [Deltaproteobacteria bacterium]